MNMPALIWIRWVALIAIVGDSLAAESESSSSQASDLHITSAGATTKGDESCDASTSGPVGYTKSVEFDVALAKGH